MSLLSRVSHPGRFAAVGPRWATDFHRVCAGLAGLFILTALAATGADEPDVPAIPYPPEIDGSTRYIYKRAGDLELPLYVFSPSDLQPGDRRAAIVFMFGGAWMQGSPGQFTPHCRYLAQHGMVAITIEYRVYSRHRVPITTCVEDAKSAIRWVRTHAGELGIDPNRIAAGGGSAGGHLAAATAVLPGFDAIAEDEAVRSTPDALVLFNPVLGFYPTDGVSFLRDKRLEELSRRFGAFAGLLSPVHYVRPGQPPTIIFHGRADGSVSFAGAELFARRMQAAGNRCELVGYDGQGHGFFNKHRGGAKYFRLTLAATHEFLASLGYVEGPENVNAVFPAEAP